MLRFDRLVMASAVLVAGTLACGDDNNEPNNATTFTATLSGGEEVPAVSTTATGTATLAIVGNQIQYTINVVGIQNAILSHIHLAPQGQNGDVRLNLCGTPDSQPTCTSGTGVLATGTNGATLGVTFDQLVTAMRTGGAYVNVHTSDGVAPSNTGPGDFPGGEIRGQIVPQ
jgi:CHRD domain